MSIFATALTAMPSPSPKKKTPNGHSISRTPRVFSRVMVLDLGESGITLVRISFSAMQPRVCSIFSQILQFIPRLAFEAKVREQ